MTPNRLPRLKAVRMPDSAIPNTGFEAVRRMSVRPGSEKQASTKAAVRPLSRSTRRQSGATTSSTCRSVSILGGPSARVAHSIFGPSSERSASSARSMPSVTVWLLLGLMTRTLSIALAPHPGGSTTPVCSEIRP